MNRKAGVAALIGPLVVRGGDPYHYDNRQALVSWTGGAPTASATAVADGIWRGGVGNGMEITAQASTTNIRELTLRVGAWEGRAKLVVSLSDASAPAYTDTAFQSTGTDGDDVVYTIAFRARSAGATLKAVWTLEQELVMGGNVTVQSAALK